MEDRLLVFVSSLIGELPHEREVVEKAVSAIPLTRPWIFEHTPASSEPLPESYLRKVRECDIFILLVGREISEWVIEEYQTAIEHEKPRLVFLKGVERAPQADAFVNEIDVKWAPFSTTDELEGQVQRAVTDELIKGYRRYRLKGPEVGKLVDFSWQLVAITVVVGDQVEATMGDVSGEVAIGKGIIQTGDIKADKSAVAFGDAATAISQTIEHITDVMLPVNAVLSAFLGLVLAMDMVSLCCVASGQPQSMCPYCNLVFSGPVAFFGLLFGVVARNRAMVALSLLVGGLAILAAFVHLLFPIPGTVGFGRFLNPFFVRLLGG